MNAIIAYERKPLRGQWIATVRLVYRRARIVPLYGANLVSSKTLDPTSRGTFRVSRYESLYQKCTRERFSTGWSLIGTFSRKLALTIRGRNETQFLSLL